MSAHAVASELRLALVGVPNSGKTALFNRLTGSHQKVANYAGVTVERKEGRFVGASGRHYRLLDLPGTYSLTPTSLDEAITRDAVLGRLAGEKPPEIVVCVVDATNLRLNLRLVLELKRIGVPMDEHPPTADTAQHQRDPQRQVLVRKTAGFAVLTLDAREHHEIS